MSTKKFPSELSSRGTVKTTDKLMIHNIDTGVTEYTTVSDLFASIAPKASPIFTGNVFAQSVYNEGSSAFSLSIDVNSGTGGRTYLLLVSRNTGSGNNTSSAMYIIRCGFDGNNYSSHYIGGSADILTFSLVSNILYATNAGAGNCKIGVFSNY